MKLSIGVNSAFAVVLFARSSSSWTVLPSKGILQQATQQSGTRSTTSSFRTSTSCTSNIFVHHRYPSKKTRVLLYGILDDITASSSEENQENDVDNSYSSNSNSNSNSIENQQAYEKLFEDLVFSTRDSRTAITEQFEACTDVCFVQYLETLQQELSTADDEERQALQDLLDAIADVIATTEAAAAAKRLATNEQQAEKAKRLAAQASRQQAEAPTSKLSNAEVLKKANAIDEAIVTVEASEDDLPDDFMRDAKAEVGLAGFNNKGQMRVGGG